MKARKAYDIFDVAFNGNSGSSLTPEEFSTLYNKAQILELQSDFFSEKDPAKRGEYYEPRSGFENTQYISERWNDLFVHFTHDCEPRIYTDEKGRLHFSEIQKHFPKFVCMDREGKVETSYPQIFHLNSIGAFHEGKEHSIHWDRHNEEKVVSDDPFRKPEGRWMRYTTKNGYYQVEPKKKRLICATVTRMPKPIWVSEDDPGSNQDPELSDIQVCRIILRALKMAGAVVGDQMLNGLMDREYREQ